MLGNGRIASEDLQLPDFINVEEARSLTLSEMRQNTLCSLLPSYLVSQEFQRQVWLVPPLWVVLLAELGMRVSEGSVPLNRAGVLFGDLTQVSEGTCLHVHARMLEAAMLGIPYQARPSSRSAPWGTPRAACARSRCGAPDP